MSARATAARVATLEALLIDAHERLMVSEGDARYENANIALAKRIERALPIAEGEAKLLYADTVTLVHSNVLNPESAVRDVIEYLIGLGSVPAVSGCAHETTIEFEIPCGSTWQAYEYAHEVDVTIGAYGIHPSISEDKIVVRPWRNTCAEAMRRLYQ